MRCLRWGKPGGARSEVMVTAASMADLAITYLHSDVENIFHAEELLCRLLKAGATVNDCALKPGP